MKSNWSGLGIGAIAAIGLWSATGHAQAPGAEPPIRPIIDANGVDLYRGRFTYSTTEVVIGQPGEGGMTFTREHYLGGWRHNYIGTMSSAANVFTVSLGGVSESFTKSGSTYTPAQGQGSELTYNSSTQKYTYKGAHGTVAVFNKTWNMVADVGANEGIIESLTFPNGEIWTFSYVVGAACYVGACQSPIPIRRLQGVSNNFGYLIKFSYALNGSTIEPFDTPEWFRVTNVRGINLAYDYCNPAADACGTFSQTWPNASYGGIGSPTTVTDALGGVTTYTSGPLGLTSIRFPGSTSDDIVVSYSDGKVSAVSRGGQQWQYAYSVGGNQTIITDPLNRTTTVAFESVAGLPTSETNALNQTTTYGYDSSGRLSIVLLPNQIQWSYGYDGRGNLITKWFRSSNPLVDPMILVYSANYDATCPSSRVKCNKPNWTRDAYDNQTDYTYSSTHGGVMTVTRPAGPGGVRPQTRYLYSALQAYYKNSSGVIVASGQNLHLLGQVSSCRTLGSCSGGSDEIQSIIGRGSTGVANNRLPVQVLTRDGAQSKTLLTKTEYDPVGNVVAVDGPLNGTGDRRVTHYDALRRVIGVVSPDPDGGGPRPSMAARTTYNARGLPATVETGTVNGLGIESWSSFSPAQTVTTEFDASYRETRRVLSSGGVAYSAVQTSYDAVGRPECVNQRMNPANFTAPASSTCTPSGGEFGPDRVVRTTYDELGRPLTVTSGYGTAEAIVAQSMHYHPTTGALEWVQDGNGNRTSYSYDTYGRLHRVYYPHPSIAGTSSSSDFEEFSYNLRSEVVSARRRGGQVISYIRDNLGRVTRKVLPGAATGDVYYSHDNDGRLLKALYGSPTGPGAVLDYDVLGRVSAKTTNGKTVGYSYDSGGRRSQLIYPDNYVVTYGYSFAGELQTLTDDTGAVLATFGYDNQGRRTGLTRPGSAASTTYGVDAISRLQSLQHDFNQTAFDTTATFSYNHANQIVGRTQSKDAVYTWTPPQPNSTVLAPVDGTNQLTSFDGSAIDADADGNLQIGLNELVYDYDIEGRLISGTGGTSTVALEYDPTGLLSKLTVNTSPGVEYVYDGGNLIAEYSGATLLRKFVHGDGADEPLVWFEGAGAGTGNRKFLHADERGSIIAVSDSAGVTTGGIKYSPQGESSGLGSQFGYTGQLYIPALGLYYYKARMYSPQTGRFLQPDPIGYAGGMNLYGYVSGDPINLRDPWGLTQQPNTEECKGSRTSLGGIRTTGGITICDPADYANPDNSLDEVQVTATRIRDRGPPSVLEIYIVPYGDRIDVTGISQTTQCTLVAPSGEYALSKADNPDARFDPKTAEMLSAALTNLNSQGIVPVITSGYRPPSVQAAQFTNPNALTPARVSWHEAGQAIDFGPNNNRQNMPAIVEAMTQAGFVWGGTFVSPGPDPRHFQSQPAGTRPSAALVAACLAASGRN